MPKSLLSALKIVVSMGVAAFLLSLVFDTIDWEEFWATAREVDYLWVSVSMALSLLAYFVRAYRWNLLLEPLGYSLKTGRTTLAVLIGYLANLVLPRLGEVTRCGVLHRNDKVALPSALGSVVSERLIDVLTLFGLIVFGFIIEADRLITFLSTAYRDLNVSTEAALAVAGGLVLMLLVGLWILQRIRKRSDKFSLIIKSFVAGLSSVKNVRNPLGFIFSTVLLWAIYYFMSYVIVFSIPETSHLGLGTGLMLLITGGIALSIPVQSGFGTYHGMIAGMLLLYSVDKTTGVFLATLLHTSQLVAVAVFGAIALIISTAIQRKERTKETK